MVVQGESSPERPGHDVAEKIIRERISQARQVKVLDIYEGLFQTIWGRILPTLGRVTVLAIMERSLTLTEQMYPSIIGPLQLTGEGVSFETLRQRVGEEEREIVGQALKELIANFIDILAMLTGDVLVRQLLQQSKDS